MDREFLLELFAAFGPVSLRRMFSGYGVSVDGTTFALVLRGSIFLKVDDQTVARFEAEGVKPFQYEQRSRGKTVTVASYWQMPDRLYDDPEELAEWARVALGAAERGAAAKQAGGRRRPRAASEPKAAKAPPAKAKRAKSRPAKSKPVKTKSAKTKSTNAAQQRKRTAARTGKR